MDNLLAVLVGAVLVFLILAAWQVYHRSIRESNERHAEYVEKQAETKRDFDEARRG